MNLLLRGAMILKWKHHYEKAAYSLGQNSKNSLRRVTDRHAPFLLSARDRTLFHNEDSAFSLSG